MPANTAIIGRVAVKVLPDTTDFRRDAERALNRVETQLGPLNIELDVDLRQVKRKLDDFKRDVNPIKVKVDPDLAGPSMAATSARLTWLSRARNVPLIPHVDSKAAIAAGTALAALSGARVVSEMFKDLWDSIKDLDKAVPIIGTVAEAIAGLSMWSLAAVSNLFALSYSLAQIGPAALALPGILGGVAIGVGVMVAALKDFNTVFPDVKDKLSAMQDLISKNFWDQAQAPIRTLIDTLLPELSAGVGIVSTQLGGFFGNLATSLRSTLAGSLAGMFFDLTRSINIAAGGTQAYAGIIKSLGEVGAGYLPRLAQWFVDISTKFDNFLTKAAGDGRLRGWIDTALVQLHELGQVLGNTFDLLAGLGRAAALAGGSTLGMLADTIGRLATAVNSTGFQQGFTKVLQAAHNGISEIATISGPAFKELGKALGEVLPRVFSLAATAIGTALDAIAGALARPEVQQGLIDLFAGLLAAVRGLAPAMSALAPVVGLLGTGLGQFAAVLGPTVAVALEAVAKAVTTLLPAVIGLIPPLNEILLSVMGPLVPLLQAAATVLAAIAPAITWIVSALAPLAPALLGAWAAFKLVTTTISFAKMIADLTETIALTTLYGAEAVANAAKAVAAWVSSISQTVALMAMYAAESVANAAKAAAAWVASAAQTVASLVTTAASFVAQGAVMVASMVATAARVVAGWVLMGAQSLAQAARIAAAWLLAMGPIPIVIAAVAGLVVLIIKYWDDIKAATTAAWNAIVGWLKSAVSSVVDWIKGHWALLLGILTGPFGLAVAAIAKHWDDIKSTVQTGIQAVVNFFTELPGKILGALGDVGSLLINAGKSIVGGLINGIESMFDKVKSTLGKLTSWLPDWKGPESTDKVLLYGAGRLIIGGLIDGMESQYDAVRRSLTGLTGDIGNTSFGVPSVTARARQIANAAAGAYAADGGGGKTLNYYAAPGSSLGAEEDLFAAASRTRMVGW